MAERDTRRLFRRRRRSARMHTALRITIAVLVAAVISAVVWMIYFSSVLAADEVKVTGTDVVSSQEIIDAAEVPMGRPMARIDLDAIEERVGELPAVEQVDVSRSWPGTIHIEVTERTAVAWLQSDGEFRGVDRYGADFTSFSEPPEDLIEIRVDTTDPRDRQQSLEELGEAIWTLGEKAPELIELIDYGQAESQDSLTFYLLDGRTVTWGSAQDSERKAEVLLALLSSVEASDYDVSAPEQPTTRS